MRKWRVSRIASSDPGGTTAGSFAEAESDHP